VYDLKLSWRLAAKKSFRAISHARQQFISKLRRLCLPLGYNYGWCNEWHNRLRHCYHNLSAMQPSTRCLTPSLRWTTALFAVLGRYRPPMRRTRVEFWRGNYGLQRNFFPLFQPSAGSKKKPLT
jgi:hypothetical protein